MEKINNWSEIKEMNDTKRIVAGGYIAKINKITDNKDKQYLEMELDIADGEFSNYYEELFASKGFWALRNYSSYKENALPMFKHFIKCVEESNNFTFDFDETKLIGKKVGIVLGFEEYIGNDGATKIKGKITSFKTINDINNGNFKVPELKKLPETNDVIIEEDYQGDLPF